MLANTVASYIHNCVLVMFVCIVFAMMFCVLCGLFSTASTATCARSVTQSASQVSFALHILNITL